MKKWLSMLLCAAIVACTAGTSYAEDDVLGLETEQTDSVIGLSEALRVSEAVELRTANSETYLLADGSYECVVYADNKYYQDETGEYREISNRIVPKKITSKGKTYDFTNEANDMSVCFSEQEPSVMIAYNGAELSFTMVGNEKKAAAGNAKVSVGEKCNDYFFEDFELQGENVITYADVLDSTDLIYSVGNGYLKEYIVIKDSSASSKLCFAYDTQNCVIKRNESGTPDVYDTDGNKIFEFDSLFAVDSAGVYTDSIKYEISDEKNGTTVVTLSIDEKYLYDSKRVFPILIDPTANVYGADQTKDSFVSSSSPSANYYSSSYLHVGKRPSSIRRSYIGFNLPSEVPPYRIQSASLVIYKSSGDTPDNIKAYRVTRSWESSTITWINKPGYSTSTSSTSSSEYLADDKYILVITDIVKNWYLGNYNNYGMVLKNRSESATNLTRFYSSDSSPSYLCRPELHIKYTAPSASTYGFTARDRSVATKANNKLNSIGYDSTMYRSSTAISVRYWMGYDAVTVICAEGIPNGGGVWITDSSGNRTALTALSSSNSSYYSLQAYYGSGTQSLNRAKFVLYHGSYSGVANSTLGCLPYETVQYGADYSAGFTGMLTGNTIVQRYWINNLFEYLGQGYGVYLSIAWAGLDVRRKYGQYYGYGDENLQDFGDMEMTLYPVADGQ